MLFLVGPSPASPAATSRPRCCGTCWPASPESARPLWRRRRRYWPTRWPPGPDLTATALAQSSCMRLANFATSSDSTAKLPITSQRRLPSGRTMQRPQPKRDASRRSVTAWPPRDDPRRPRPPDTRRAGCTSAKPHPNPHAPPGSVDLPSRTRDVSPEPINVLAPAARKRRRQRQVPRTALVSGVWGRRRRPRCCGPGPGADRWGSASGCLGSRRTGSGGTTRPAGGRPESASPCPRRPRQPAPAW
jgi:hypothetical protein